MLSAIHKLSSFQLIIYNRFQNHSLKNCKPIQILSCAPLSDLTSKMKPSLLVSLLLFSLIVSQAQGIRLERGFFSARHHRLHEEESSAIKTTNGGGNGDGHEGVNGCREGHCKGMNRKLIPPSTSSVKTEKNGESRKGNPTWKGLSVSDNEGFPGKQDRDDLSDNPPRSLEHREVSSEQYADLMGIAEMDYSPAKRKPPIHN